MYPLFSSNIRLLFVTVVYVLMCDRASSPPCSPLNIFMAILKHSFVPHKCTYISLFNVLLLFFRMSQSLLAKALIADI